MKLGEQVTVLEREFKNLATSWERYFAGDLKLPPVKERTKLEQRLRQVYEHPGYARRVDQFRLENLQHRFMTYAQNWERMLREREEGRVRGVAAAKGASPAPPPPLNGASAASVHTSGGDTLFERYQRAKAALGHSVPTDREAFESKIAAQREALEARLGSGVVFEVKVEDDKVKLAARRAGKGHEKG